MPKYRPSLNKKLIKSFGTKSHTRGEQDSYSALKSRKSLSSKSTVIITEDSISQDNPTVKKTK